MKLAASILALACCATPLGAFATDHVDARPEPPARSDPAPPARSEPAPPARSEPAPPVRSEPAPEPRSAPVAPEPHTAPVAPAPIAPAPRSAPVSPVRSDPVGGEPRALPPANEPTRPPHPGPVQPLPIYRAKTPIANPQPAPLTQPPPNPDNDQPWDWNSGNAWIGYGGYWGNGFWGPLAYGLGAAAYVVAAGSPGAQLLQAYQLTQTPCGPPNLVEIYGPDGSEICAIPNAHVAPGVYFVDYDTLTLYSKPPQTEIQAN